MGLVPALEYPVSGPADPTVLTDNDDKIRTVVNGNIDANNLAANAVTTAKITDANVTTAKIADAAVTTAKITDANVTDTKLASPNNGVFKTIHKGTTGVTAGLTAGSIYIPTVGGFLSGGGVSPQVDVVRIAPADLLVAGKTTKLRLCCSLILNSPTMGSSVATFGLYPITAVSGTTTVTWTLGSVVTGSTIVHDTTDGSGIAPQYTSSEFDCPANTATTGFIVAVAITGATVPSNVWHYGSYALQARNT